MPISRELNRFTLRLIQVSLSAVLILTPLMFALTLVSNAAHPITLTTPFGDSLPTAHNVGMMGGPLLSIAASPSAVSVGGPLAVTWNIPGNQSQTDWVGLYRVGAPDTAGRELWWRYTGGSPTGSFTLNAPLVAGQYEFRLLLNNSFSHVATSNSVTVSSTPTPIPTPTPVPSYSIAASPSAVSVGSPLAVTWNIPSNQTLTDWVGLYRVGAPPTAGNELWWRYTGGFPTGSFTLNAPLVAGQYEFRLSLNNSFSPVATSNSVTVSSTSTPTPTPLPTPTSTPSPSPTPTPTPTPPPPDGAQFYVSPSGSSSGDGSINNPWSIWKAIVTPGVVPAGSTVYLRGGTYILNPNQTYWEVAGTVVRPIIVRPYPGERASIDVGDQLYLYGNYVHYIGGGEGGKLEFMDSKTQKVFNGGWDPNRLGTVLIAGDGIKVINCVFHDILGTNAFEAAENTEMYGNIYYYIGNISNEIPGGLTFGATCYIQNRTGTKTFSNNISFSGFRNGLQVYGSEASIIKNVTIEGNTIFNPAALASSGGFNSVVWKTEPGIEQTVVENIIFSDNYLYSPPDKGGTNAVFWGVGGVVNKNLTLTRNHIVGGFPVVRFGTWNPVVVTNNTLVGIPGPLSELLWQEESLGANRTWNNNSYYLEQASREFLYVGAYYNFAGWKAVTGVDTNSTYSASRPTGQEVFVRPNTYEQGRANITIFNWDSAATANVNLSTSGLTNGQSYEIRDAQNFFGAPILTGIYSSSSPTVTVTLPGTGSPVSPVIGANDPINAGFLVLPVHTSKEFNALVLLPR